MHDENLKLIPLLLHWIPISVRLCPSIRIWN